MRYRSEPESLYDRDLWGDGHTVSFITLDAGRGYGGTVVAAVTVDVGVMSSLPLSRTGGGTEQKVWRTDADRQGEVVRRRQGLRIRV